MVSLKKYVPCRCGANNSFDFSSDMNIDDLTLSARCPCCGAAVCVSVSALISGAPAAPLAQTGSPGPSDGAALADAHDEAETKANVEQAVRDLFR